MPIFRILCISPFSFFQFSESHSKPFLEIVLAFAFSLYSWCIIYHVSRIEIYHIWYMMYPNILRWILPGHFVIWRNGSEFDKIKEISKDSSSSYPTAENKRTSIVLKHELGPETFIMKQVSRDKHCDIFQ